MNRKDKTTTTKKVKTPKAPVVPVVKINKISRTEANRQRRIEKDQRAKDEAKRKQIEKNIEDKQLLALIAARTVVACPAIRLPDRHARQAVRDWQERKALRNMLAMGYGA